MVVEIDPETKLAGMYFRQRKPLSPDGVFRLMPKVVVAARELLVATPEFDVIEVCEDAPWSVHPKPDTFVTAAQVKIHRNRLARVPAQAMSTDGLFALALRDKVIDLTLDTEILRQSEAYAHALRTVKFS